MPIIATDKGNADFELPLAGSYIARCYKLIDVGTQETTFQGKPSTPKRQLLVWFELLEDEEGGEYRMSDGQPFSVMNRYTLSTQSNARLRQHIDAWRGKALTNKEAEAFDVEKLLGQYCRLQIVLSESGDRTYVNIGSLGYTRKAPAGVNETFSWTISAPDMKAFAEFPAWLQAKIEAAHEWPTATADTTAPATATPAAEAPAEDTTVSKKSGDVVLQDLPDGDVDLSNIKF